MAKTYSGGSASSPILGLARLGIQSPTQGGRGRAKSKLGTAGKKAKSHGTNTYGIKVQKANTRSAVTR